MRIWKSRGVAPERHLRQLLRFKGRVNRFGFNRTVSGIDRPFPLFSEINVLDSALHYSGPCRTRETQAGKQPQGTGRGRGVN